MVQTPYVMSITTTRFAHAQRAIAAVRLLTAKKYQVRSYFLSNFIYYIWFEYSFKHLVYKLLNEYSLVILSLHICVIYILHTTYYNYTHQFASDIIFTTNSSSYFKFLPTITTCPQSLISPACRKTLVGVSNTHNLRLYVT